MKKFLLALVAALVVLVLFLIGRTTQFTLKQVEVAPANGIAVNAELAAGHLAQALRFQTVSYQDPAQFQADQFLGLHHYLEQTYPHVHAALSREVVNDYSLLYTWKGADEKLKPILLLAHMDVVPIESGTEGKWTHPPFAGQMADGYLWGRGALDDKDSLIAIFEAIETLLGEGFQPRRTIYLAFGHDEEVSGQNGAARIAALLRSRGVAPEFVNDEGGAIVRGVIPGLAAPIAQVSTAEKGYITLELSANGPGGHSSVPPPHTSIGILSRAVRNLEDQQMPARLCRAQQQALDTVGPALPFSRRAVLANLWLFRPLVLRLMASDPTSNALVRTTTAVTMFEAGTKENILPSEAHAVVNFRILPGDTVEGVVAHVRAVINDPSVKVRVLGQPNDPPAEASADSPTFQLFARTIRQVFPGLLVTPGLLSGATDSRHYAQLTRNIYRFTAAELGPGDLQRIHGTNERISVTSWANVVRFYIQLLRNAAP